MDTTLLIAIMPGFLASVVSLVNSWQIRKSKVNKLVGLNDKQAGELIVLSTTMLQILGVQDVLLDALHQKGVLNGNSIEIKKGLKDATDNLTRYAQEQKNKGLYFECKE